MLPAETDAAAAAYGGRMVQQPPLPPSIPFDPNQLIPLVGLIGAMIVGGVVLYAFFKSDLAAAIAERIRSGMHRRKHWKGLDGATDEEPRVAQVEEQVEQLHGQVAELAERLDFAERLLAQKRERTLRAGE
jgi:hypothetical protein